MSYDWDKHYQQGGVSGDPTDYDIVRGWKMHIIRKYCNLQEDTFLDIGCGDLQFWNSHLPYHYTGIDISPTIIEKNKRSHPHHYFKAMNAANAFMFPKDVTLCFDMLWHIIDDTDYEHILHNIKNNTRRTALIFTWSANPTQDDLWKAIVTKVCDIRKGGYQKYRDFQKIAFPIFEPDFECVEVVQNLVWTFGSMYVFRRKE